jgi:hypothetical protein
MNAASFYRHFESEFASSVEALPQLRRASEKTCKWRLPAPDGSLLLSFATNFKCAGLHPEWPGEFRLTATWSHGKGPQRKHDYVSYFQYTTDAEAAEYADLQRRALSKFLRQPGKDSMKRLFDYVTDPSQVPRANFDEFAYYFDEEDACAWGMWYRNSLPGWVARFVAAPETHEDWSWRVLWPHLKRGPHAAR